MVVGFTTTRTRWAVLVPRLRPSTEELAEFVGAKEQIVEAVLQITEDVVEVTQRAPLERI